MINKRNKGSKFERIAAAYLYKELNYEILEMNFRCRIGEIDIIAKDGSTLCFIEVKYRKDDSFGMPQEAVDIKKQKKILLVSAYYRTLHNIRSDYQIRFDVVAILGNRIKIIKNAFGGI
jgi:putative endonuclease